MGLCQETIFTSAGSRVSKLPFQRDLDLVKEAHERDSFTSLTQLTCEREKPMSTTEVTSFSAGGERCPSELSHDVADPSPRRESAKPVCGLVSTLKSVRLAPRPPPPPEAGARASVAGVAVGSGGGGVCSPAAVACGVRGGMVAADGGGYL